MVAVAEQMNGAVRLAGRNLLRCQHPERALGRAGKAHELAVGLHARLKHLVEAAALGGFRLAAGAGIVLRHLGGHMCFQLRHRNGALAVIVRLCWVLRPV